MLEPMGTIYKAVVDRGARQIFLFASSLAPADQHVDALTWAKLLPLHDGPGASTYLTMEVSNGLVPGYDPGDEFNLMAIMVFAPFGGPAPTEESGLMWDGWKKDHLARGGDLGITVDYLSSSDGGETSPKWLIDLMDQHSISM